MDDQEIERVPELDVSLDDLHAFLDALQDHAEGYQGTGYGAYIERLARRVLGLWSFWECKTEATDTFTLRIKRM